MADNQKLTPQESAALEAAIKSAMQALQAGQSDQTEQETYEEPTAYDTSVAEETYEEPETAYDEPAASASDAYYDEPAAPAADAYYDEPETPATTYEEPETPAADAYYDEPAAQDTYEAPAEEPVTAQEDAVSDAFAQAIAAAAERIAQDTSASESYEEPEAEDTFEASAYDAPVSEPAVEDVAPAVSAAETESTKVTEENTKKAAKAAEKESKKAKKAEKAAKKAATPAPAASKSGKGKKMRTYQQRQDRAGYGFMLPWIIGFVLFTLFPFVMTIYLSFTNVKSTIYGYEIKWNGVKNYYTAFFTNESFLPALLAYLRMIIPYTFIVVVLSFIIAYLLCKINVGKSILRTIYFLPVIIMSGPVMSQLLSVSNVSTSVGEAAEAYSAYSNIFIMQMIQSYSPALANGLAEIFNQLSIILWFTGIPIVLFINGLQKINPSIYEAAKIDSANAWQIMWKITIPMLKSVGLIITVFTVIQLGMYDSINPVYELIEDATSDTTGGLGFAATYSWIYSIIALLLIGIVFLLFRERTPKDIKARKRQEKKLQKLEKQQQRRLAAQKRHQAKEAKLYGK